MKLIASIGLLGIIASFALGMVAIVESYCKVSHKEDELRRYENEDYGIWDEW